MTSATTENECPDQVVLIDFLQGKLVPPDLETCEAHVENCQACHETLRGMNPSDTLATYVTNAMQLSPVRTDEQAAKELAQRLVNQDSFSGRTRNQLSAIDVMQDRAAEVLRHVSPDTEDPTSLGTLDNFRLLELIGAGGTGVVFRAYDFSLDREVALKVLRPSLGDIARDRFVAEAKAAASIDHENVVTIYQVGQHERLAWIAMQWVPGETLESRLHRDGTLQADEVRRLTGQIAKGLAEAHRRQLVHRDIKPANIWIGDADRKARILDFGLVRVADNAPALTATGMLAGTPNFMSPEQAKGQELDARSDLFSLGCVMYQMLTGRLPFGSSTILGTLQSIQSQRPETPIQSGADCCQDLSDLTMALLEKQPANRIESAELLGECLECPRGQWPVRVANYADTNVQETQSITRPVASHGGSRNWVWMTGCLLALFGFGMWLFAPQIIRIATNQGELVIETEDENVQVEVRENGELIRVLDASSGASFDVRSGNFEISAIGKDGKAEFQVKPNQLVMSRGDREVVRVTLAKAAATSATQAQMLASSSQTQKVFNGKPFSHWLQIAKSETKIEVRADAIAACGKLCESPEQFGQLAVVLDQMAAAEKLFTIKDGKWILDRNVLRRDFGIVICRLSPSRVVDYLVHQLANGNKLSLLNTFTVLDEYGDSRSGYGEVQLTEALEKSAQRLRPHVKKWKDILPAKLYDVVLGFGFISDESGQQGLGNVKAPVASGIGVFRGKALKEWLSVLKNDQDPVTQADALVACATLYDSEGLHQDLYSLLNDYLNQHAARQRRYLSTKNQKTLHAGFVEAFEKLSAEKAIDFLAYQLQHGIEVQLHWTYDGIFKSQAALPYKEIRIRSEELLTLCAKRPHVGSTEISLFSDFVKCGVFRTADPKIDEAANQLLMRMSAVELIKAIDFLPKDMIDQGFFDLIKKELFSKDTKAYERDRILRGLFDLDKRSSRSQMLSADKLGEDFIMVQTLLAEVIANQLQSPSPIKFDSYLEKGYYTWAPGPAVVARHILSKIGGQLSKAVKDADQELYKKNGLEAAKKIHAIIALDSGSADDSDSEKLYELIGIKHDIDMIGLMGKGKSGEFSPQFGGYGGFGLDVQPRSSGRRSPRAPSSRK